VNDSVCTILGLLYSTCRGKICVFKSLEDKAKRTETSFLGYAVARDENPVNLWEMDLNSSCIS
jgi:hypothetical protein